MSIVNLVVSHLGLEDGNLVLIAPVPGHCFLFLLTQGGCLPLSPESIHVDYHFFKSSISPKRLVCSKQKLIWSLLGKGGMKVYIYVPGQMTKMAAMPKHGKTSRIL